jgi:hypothetical protein
MKAKNLDIHQIAANRLAVLGCDHLPVPVRERIVKDFISDAERKLNRLARRQITIPRIAKIFTASMQPQEGVLEGGRHATPSNEMGTAHDASGGMRQDP